MFEAGLKLFFSEPILGPPKVDFSREKRQKCPRRRASRVPPLQGRNGLQLGRCAGPSVFYVILFGKRFALGLRNLLQKVKEENTNEN